MYRQGDLLFIKVDKKPKELSRIYTNIIARGEATGHAHTLIGGELYHYWDSEANEERMFIIIDSMGKVIHEEHKPIILEKGYWIVIRQKEYSPRGPEYVLE
jgi:hypothetical protein